MNDEFYEDNLRTFPGPKSFLDYEDVPFFGSLPELLRSIRLIFGLEIEFIRAGGTLPDMMARCFTIKVENGKSPGCLALLPSKNIQNNRNNSMNLAEQDNFLTSLALLLGEAYRWQQMFRKYEGELASLIPVPTTDINETLFSETLFGILKESAKILDCQAASLYVLETATNLLKLRSCWGLPEERLLDSARPLHDSMADLEAILGQAVILNEDYLFEAWGAPEDFPTAICVPVASPMSIIGTLWFFSDRQRHFSEHDLRLLEIITGRLAAEIERASLLRELEHSQKLKTSA
ncbi:MAG: GAF domain-containing protein [Planctomycetaceae bacterium]|jgi:transcriptional regulator with GAF, ATPase, and Fis domain|nr:GAF domain-containing protein [Planctomycetaceae bacterium]